MALALPSFGGSKPSAKDSNKLPLSELTFGDARTDAEPKKKRIRRQQVELKNLHGLVTELEYHLSRLKKHRDNSAQHILIMEDRPSKKCTPVSVWERIANSQFHERTRAEKLNKELKQSLRIHNGKAQSLHCRMQKALRDEDISSQDEGGVFANLFTLIAKIWSEVDNRRIDPPQDDALSFARWGISGGAPKLKAGAEGDLVMENYGCSLLPFDVNTTAAACWRIFAMSPLGDNLSPDQVADSAGDMIARSFACTSIRYDERVPVQGKYACCKYTSDDCTTIVFAGRSSPLEITSDEFTEVQIQESGWVHVRQAPSSDPKYQQTSILEMHSEILPRFQRGNADQERRAQEIVDCISKSHQVINSWYSQALSEMLVEEDWKAWSGMP